MKPWFDRYRGYFPIKAVVSPEAEAALDNLKSTPRSIILASHPHGIVSIGTVTNLALDPSWFSERFPHVNLRLLTLNMNVIWPFWRDWMLSLGVASVERASCEAILRQTDKGRSHGIAIVVGGAREALDADPGRMDLTLNSRNGIFKLALRHGTFLFPVLNFGENDVYDQLDNWLIRSIQQVWIRMFGFSTPFFFGRGVFNYKFGWLPRRIPITTVIGPPLDVPTVAHPTEKEVHDLRKQYVHSLKELYARYKDEYEIVPCPNGLRIVR